MKDCISFCNPKKTIMIINIWLFLRKYLCIVDMKGVCVKTGIHILRDYFEIMVCKIFANGDMVLQSYLVH